MTTAVQTLTSFALAVSPVLAPVAAPDFGVPAERVGILVSFFFAVAIVSGLLSSALVRRFGPIATLRACVLLIGLAFVCGAGTHVVLVIAYALIAGLAHGTINPVSSLVLAQAVPPQVRSMVFSIKQTGVPLGFALAGLLVPPLLLVMAWQQAIIFMAVGSLFLLFALRPFYSLFDGDRQPGAAIAFPKISESFAEVFGDREIRDLAIASAVFAIVQMAVTTFLVSFLHLELAYSLIAAGAVFSALSIASVFGRVFWGWVADRTGNPRGVLAGLGFLMGVCCIAGGFFSPAWPLWAVVVVAVLWGISAVAWNGVLLAEVARLAPPGKIASMTSGVQAVFFAGSVIGPAAFGAGAALLGEIGVCYLLLAPLPLVFGGLLLRTSVRAARTRQAGG